MDIEHENAHEYVKRARESMGMSPTEFGVQLGVTRQTVWRYETGDPVPLRVRLAITALLTEHQKEKVQ